MNKFKVGDLVIVIVDAYGEPAHCEVLKTGLTYNGSPYSELSIKGKYFNSFYDNAITLSRTFSPKEIEERKYADLIVKINTLYERQSWVKEGKPTATCYTKQPVQSVENKDMTVPEITSESTLMVTNTVSNAVIQDRVIEDIRENRQRLV